MTINDTRVSSYLDDLARMLTDLDPADRDEVLAGVREHLDATLAEHPDDPAAVDAALLRLGPPERIAAEARAALGSASDPTTRKLPHRAWLVTGLVLTGLTTVPFTAATGIALVVDQVDGGQAGWSVSLPLMSSPVLMVVLTWPLWMAGVVALVVARRWIPRTWKPLLGAGPIAVATVALGSPDLSPEPLSTFIGIPLLLAATVLVLAGIRSAWRESAAH